MLPTCLLAGRQGPQLLAQPGRAAAALISHCATFLGRRNCRWQLVISQASPFHYNFSLQNGGFPLSRGIGGRAQHLLASRALSSRRVGVAVGAAAATVFTLFALPPRRGQRLVPRSGCLAASPTRSGKSLGSPCTCCSIASGEGGWRPGSEGSEWTVRGQRPLSPQGHPCLCV